MMELFDKQLFSFLIVFIEGIAITLSRKKWAPMMTLITILTIVMFFMT